MAEDKLLFIGQKAFIRKGDEVLTLQISGKRLDFPGGKIQENELDVIDALKREIREETGLEVTVDKPFTTWITEFKSNGLPKTIFFVGYTCVYESGEVTLSHEHEAYKWVTKDIYHDVSEESEWFKALDLYFKREYV